MVVVWGRPVKRARPAARGGGCQGLVTAPSTSLLMAAMVAA